jgi:hypothetical protein
MHVSSHIVEPTFQEGHKDILGGQWMGYGYSPSSDIPRYDGTSGAFETYADGLPPSDEPFYGQNLDLGRDATLSQASTASLSHSSRALPTTGANPYPHGAYVDRRRKQPGNLLDSAPDRIEQGELAVQLAMIES